MIGAAVGLAVWFVPLAVGGGDGITQNVITGAGPVLTTIAGDLLVRFVAGPVCCAAGTPGGIFALTRPTARARPSTAPAARA